MDKRKRELAKGYRAAQRKAIRESFPLSVAALREIFEMLDERLVREACDHSLRHTTGWLTSRQLEPEPVIRWFNEKGGFCDCEVLANVEDTVEDAAKGE